MTRPHGVKGEVFVSLFAPEKELAGLIAGQTVEISHSDKGGATFWVQKARSHKKGLILKLRGLDSFSQALELKTAFLFGPAKLFQTAVGENIYLCEVLGFKVFKTSKLSASQKKPAVKKENQKENKEESFYLGQVVGWTYNGAQDLMRVRNSSQNLEMDIPFIPHFIIDIDFKTQHIHVHYPP